MLLRGRSHTLSGIDDTENAEPSNPRMKRTVVSCLAVHRCAAAGALCVPSQQHRSFSETVYSPNALKLTRAQATEQLATRVERLSEIANIVSSRELTVLNLKKQALSVELGELDSWPTEDVDERYQVVSQVSETTKDSDDLQAAREEWYDLRTEQRSLKKETARLYAYVARLAGVELLKETGLWKDVDFQRYFRTITATENEELFLKNTTTPTPNMPRIVESFQEMSKRDIARLPPLATPWRGVRKEIQKKNVKLTAFQQFMSRNLAAERKRVDMDEMLYGRDAQKEAYLRCVASWHEAKARKEV